jgi:hypothetical protein
VELLQTIWPPALGPARFSPFHYYAATGILAGTAQESRNLAVLGITAFAALVLAYWSYQRRDL